MHSEVFAQLLSLSSEHPSIISSNQLSVIMFRNTKQGSQL